MKTRSALAALLLSTAASVPATAGPTLPYAEVQAENAATNGTIIGGTRAYPSLASESIGTRNRR